MTDILEQMELKLLEFLGGNYQKSAEHLAEELKVEYPQLYKQIIQRFAQEYGLGGCGAQMSPHTAVQQTLASLQKKGLVECEQTNGNVLWQKKTQ
ncbi:hypothetical protein [Dethiobacter alkaliphilus]|uniref:hypothetical protein n=1 Tax=Dethiobacter alkaliphilus TaxID=427926 RepID=UPI0022265DBB|nr:hypothetical protein [Dethiobacter alkaliphilus]MCW3490947.1 hypothetical protein [Dethiobacter alkaliphilus]